MVAIKTIAHGIKINDGRFTRYFLFHADRAVSAVLYEPVICGGCQAQN
jgi:hypothetical protein